MHQHRASVPSQSRRVEERDDKLGIPYALDPRKTSVITSVGRGDPMGLGLWKVLLSDDRGDDWNLSVMNRDAELEFGVPWIGF